MLNERHISFQSMYKSRSKFVCACVSCANRRGRKRSRRSKRYCPNAGWTAATVCPPAAGIHKCIVKPLRLPTTTTGSAIICGKVWSRIMDRYGQPCWERLRSWPEMQALRTLGEKVLPLIRNAEKTQTDLK